jgi:hypothetical protein
MSYCSIPRAGGKGDKGRAREGKGLTDLLNDYYFVFQLESHDLSEVHCEKCWKLLG